MTAQITPSDEQIDAEVADIEARQREAADDFLLALTAAQAFSVGDLSTVMQVMALDEAGLTQGLMHLVHSLLTRVAAENGMTVERVYDSLREDLAGVPLH